MKAVPSSPALTSGDAGQIVAPLRPVPLLLNGGHGLLALKSIENEILLFLRESVTFLLILHVFGGNSLGACWCFSEFWKPGPRLQSHGCLPGRLEESQPILSQVSPNGQCMDQIPKRHFWGVGKSGVLGGRGLGTPWAAEGLPLGSRLSCWDSVLCFPASCFICLRLSLLSCKMRH